MGEDTPQLNIKEVFYLRRLMDYGRLKRCTAVELARYLDVGPSNPYFINFLRQLRYLGIIEILEIVGNSKILSLDYEKIRMLYWDQKETQEEIDVFVKHYVSSINYL